jgi:hypothetical protein
MKRIAKAKHGPVCRQAGKNEMKKLQKKRVHKANSFLVLLKLSTDY